MAIQLGKALKTLSHKGTGTYYSKVWISGVDGIG